MKYLWLRIPWLVSSRFTSWVWWPGIVVSKCSRDSVSYRHRMHEEQHIRQHRTWLILSPLVWSALAVFTRFDYAAHPWEVEARRAPVKLARWKQTLGIIATFLVLLLLANRLGLDGA